MTIGISKERLEEILQSNQCTFEREILDEIIKECTELNPWLPIEKSPKDRIVLLAFPMCDGSYEYAVDFARESATVRDFNAKGMPEIKPTHYQELPGDPD